MIRRLLALALFACAVPAVAQTKIVLGYTPANAFMPAFVAKDKGFFRKRGLDVTLQTVPQGSTIAGAMAGGTLQVGTLTAPAYLLSVEGGIDTQIVAASTYQAKANPTIGLMAREGSNIKSAAEMKGKRMGVPGLNGVNHIVAMKWLENNGVQRNQVTYVETGFAQMGDLLKGGQVDLVVPVEPFITRIQQTKVGYQVTVPSITESYLESFYIMMRDFVQKNPKAARDFREALREAVEYIKTNEAEARKTQVTYLKLPEAAAASIKLPTFAVDVKADDVDFWVKLLKDFGITKGTATAQQVVFQ
ncbi:MAG TPA: ABC transporter substrate-binding protein [Burkholderiales bacterium]|nr:ABC transporter substrate-binding protein [Burkholderiales bacterium]